MVYRKSYCCLLCRFVALFTLFSILLGVNVNAATILGIDSEDVLAGSLNIRRGIYAYSDSLGGWKDMPEKYIEYPSNSLSGIDNVKFNISDNSNLYMLEYLFLENNDGTYIFKAGESARVEYNNVYSGLLVNKISTGTEYVSKLLDVSKIDYIKFRVWDAQGIDHTVDAEIEFTNTSQSLEDCYSVVINFPVLDYDVYRATLVYGYHLDTMYGYASTHRYFTSEFDYLLKFGFSTGSMMVDLNDESIGLLQGIIDWLKSIKDGITNVFSTLREGFSAMVTVITELPEQIWMYFQEGLIALVVPSEDDVTNFNTKMNNLLEDRFGALYEVGELCVEHVQAFQQYYEVGTISFPATTVDLAGVPFTFGGWTVDICPDGFEFLFDALKLAINMVCTLAVISSLKNRFDRLLGVR